MDDLSIVQDCTVLLKDLEEVLGDRYKKPNHVLVPMSGGTCIIWDSWGLTNHISIRIDIRTKESFSYKVFRSHSWGEAWLYEYPLTESFKAEFRRSWGYLEDPSTFPAKFMPLGDPYWLDPNKNRDLKEAANSLLGDIEALIGEEYRVPDDHTWYRDDPSIHFIWESRKRTVNFGVEVPLILRLDIRDPKVVSYRCCPENMHGYVWEYPIPIDDSFKQEFSLAWSFMQDPTTFIERTQPPHSQTRR